MRIAPLAFWLLILALAGADAQAAGRVEASHSSAELVADVSAVKAGGEFRAALHITLQDGWHTYWKNPGDYGLATSIAWDVPSGITAGALQWPAPQRIVESDVVTYGYSGEAWYLTPIQVAENVTGNITLKAKANWLVCKETCIPQSADLDLTLPVNEAAQPSDTAEKIYAQRMRLPAGDVEFAYLTVMDKAVSLAIKPEVPFDEKAAFYFFPAAAGVLDHTDKQQFSVAKGVIMATIKRGTVPVSSPLEGVLVAQSGKKTQSFAIIAGDPAVATLPGGKRPFCIISCFHKIRDVLQAMFFALLGGIILNAMPCVFPILSLKALAVAKKAEKDPREVCHQGLAYTAGVVLSFVLLAGVLIALQAAGQRIGWGFQMQSPPFVLAMVYLLFLVGLMLSGLFVLPSLFAGAGGRLAGADNLSGSFFTGVLATLVATPCTAPFMAPALGFALTQPPHLSLLVFVALGLGLALPYLLISFNPRLLARLPKPGLWMERFKQFLAFPMYGSAAWLLWVLAQQSGEGGLAAALAGVVMLGFFAWLAGVWQGRPRVWRVVVWLLAAATVAASFAALDERPASAVPQAVSSHGAHEPYDAARLDALLEEGKPVFVNATAAWCITCKINEKSSLSRAEVHQKMQELGITYMVADWTNEDPAITQLLAVFGRSGVPLYVVYAPGREPEVLPQLLTPAMVLDAFDRTQGER